MQLRHNCTPLFLNQSTFDYFRAVYKNVLLTKKERTQKKIECEYQQKKKKGKEKKKQKGNIMERFYWPFNKLMKQILISSKKESW